MTTKFMQWGTCQKSIHALFCFCYLVMYLVMSKYFLENKTKALCVNMCALIATSTRATFMNVHSYTYTPKGP